MIRLDVEAKVKTRIKYRDLSRDKSVLRSFRIRDPLREIILEVDEKTRATDWKGKSFPYKLNSMMRKGVEEIEREEQKRRGVSDWFNTFLQHPQSCLRTDALNPLTRNLVIDTRNLGIVKTLKMPYLLNRLT